MAEKYQCPMALRVKNINFIMCKNRVGDTQITANMVKEAAQAYCPHQSFCSCRNGNENTDSARACYTSQMRERV